MEAIWILIGVVVFLIGTSVAVLLYLNRTKEKKIRKIRESSGLNPKNEAYNTVKSTQSIAGLMKGDGENTEEVDILLDRAQMALDSGNHSKAKQLAEKARDKLGAIKQDKDENEISTERTYMKKLRKKKEDTPDRYDVDTHIKLEKQKEKIMNFPDNYLESKFELNQAKDLIDEQEGSTESKELLREAEKQFEEGDYTEALRLSIRCKKMINEKQTGLIGVAKKEEDKVVTDDKVEKSEFSERVEKKGEHPKKQIVCPECGYEVGRDDKFCRNCGVELASSMKCPSCGSEVNKEDNYCPRCGTEISISKVYECPECGVSIDKQSKFCPNCGVQFE
ncbi:MAG: zinc ribbon domain-containing protein [Thermoplasmatota archaeon]